MISSITHWRLYLSCPMGDDTSFVVISNVEADKVKQAMGGAKASGVYIPAKTDYRKDELMENFRKEGEKLIAVITEKWKDEQLDHYQVKHPILGLLTMRELAYFTIYHNGHHLGTIRKYYS